MNGCEFNDKNMSQLCINLNYHNNIRQLYLANNEITD